RALHDSLAAFVEEAARQLADEVSGGAEVPFELMEMSPHARATSPLYCYRPLTGRFIGERIGVLARLPSYPAASQGMAALPALAAYLPARGRRPAGAGHPRAGRRRAAGLPDRGLGGGDRVQLRPDPLRPGLRRAGDR